MSQSLETYYPKVDPEAIGRALMAGDLARLSPEDRVQYYFALCRSSGLNPLTRPFIVIQSDGGELTWYPTRECAEQFRKLHHVSMTVLSREKTEDGLYVVTVEARMPDGRVEQAQGIVSILRKKGSWKTTEKGKNYFQDALTPDGEPIMTPMRGTELANALQKAESKAKRRATLALCGLGLPDVDDRPAVPFNPQTGHLADHAEAAEQAEEALKHVTPEHAATNITALFDRSAGAPEAPAGQEG
jgi:hypothetical protein